jgi:hypothetical protein
MHEDDVFAVNFFNISISFISQRRKQRRKRIREILMTRHLKRATMVTRRDGNLIISLIHQIGLSCLSTFPMLLTIGTANRNIPAPRIPVQVMVPKLVIPEFAAYR